MKANVVLVGINWRLAPPEITYILNDAQVEVLFVGAEYVGLVNSIAGDLPAIRHFIAIDAPQGEWLVFNTWSGEQSADDPMLPISPGADMLQLYTSGTTGYPKGVQLTHANYLAFFLLSKARRLGELRPWRRQSYRCTETIMSRE